MQYIYPVGGEIRCLADALAALNVGYCILIEPPGSNMMEGSTDVSSQVPAAVPRG